MSQQSVIQFTPRPDTPKVQKVASVLWPSFLTAGLATVIFFMVFDPRMVADAGGFSDANMLSIYSIGFFSAWLTTGVSCALANYFGKPCPFIGQNHCPHLTPTSSSSTPESTR